MSKNRIKPMPPSLGNSKITMQPRASQQGHVMFFESDLPLLGIVKETNNYPPSIPIPEITDGILSELGEFLLTEGSNNLIIE
jgi:hypothetical protein